MLEADHARMQRELKEVQIKAAAEIKEVRKQASAESDHLTSHNRLIARQREDDLAMLKVRRLRCARCPRLGAHGHARASPCLFVFARVGCGRDFVTQEQYAEVQAMYAARVKALEEKLSALRQKCVCYAFRSPRGHQSAPPAPHSQGVHGGVGAVRHRHKALEKRRNMELEGFTIDVANLRREVSGLLGSGRVRPPVTERRDARGVPRACSCGTWWHSSWDRPPCPATRRTWSCRSWRTVAASPAERPHEQGGRPNARSKSEAPPVSLDSTPSAHAAARQSGRARSARRPRSGAPAAPAGARVERRLRVVHLKPRSHLPHRHAPLVRKPAMRRVSAEVWCRPCVRGAIASRDCIPTRTVLTVCACVRVCV